MFPGCPQPLSSSAPRTPGRALLPPPTARILLSFPDAELPRDESSLCSLRGEALSHPGSLSPPAASCLPGANQYPALCSALCPSGPLKAPGSSRSPVSPSLPRYPPLAPAPHPARSLPSPPVLRRASRLCEFRGSSPSGCRCLESLAGFENFPSVPFRAAAPVNSRLSAPAPFIMPGLPLPRFRPRPSAPSGPLRPLPHQSDP